MKKIALLIVLIAGFSLTSKAQQTIAQADLKNNIGKTVTLCDVVYSVKIVSDTLTLLNMGAAYPNQKFTVAIKGNKIVLDWINLKTKHLCATGTLELYKNTLQLVISQPSEIKVD
jgi:hypothetical protein